MNQKADNFSKYLYENNINYFKREDSVTVSEDANNMSNKSDNSSEKSPQVVNKTTFHTYVKVFGQKLATVVIIDESIYTLIRVQVIPDVSYSKNTDEFYKCINEMNITYKAVKYYLGTDDALYLDMYIPSLTDDIDGNLVINILSAMNIHLEKEYPNWMKLLWG